MRWFLAICLFSLPALAQDFDYEAEGINDTTNNEVRSLCMLMLAEALPAGNFPTPEWNPDKGMMIHAHTQRDDAINCFFTLGDASYLLFFKLENGAFTGMVVRYRMDTFSTFTLTP